VNLTAAERILVHLHGFLNAREPSRGMTQAGIAEGCRILRSHVPRALRALSEEGLVEASEARLRGRTRRVRVYALTEAGVRRARVLLDEVDDERVDFDGRTTSFGEVRRDLGLAPLDAYFAVDAGGRLVPPAAKETTTELLQREEDLAFLRRWLAGPAPVAVLYGSRGIGKTALGRAFARSISRSIWLEGSGSDGVRSWATTLGRATGRAGPEAGGPDSAVRALLGAFDAGTKLVVFDGYGEVPEETVEVLRSLLRLAREHAGVKLLVLAQETTPSYCRFYGRPEVDNGLVAERHLKGLDLEGCRAMLGNPSIDEEALRRIFLLTKGCPLYLQFIREGDEDGLRAHSRFTNAEIRLLLYSRGVPRLAPAAS